MAVTLTVAPPSRALNKQGIYVTLHSDNVDTEERTNFVLQVNGTPPFDFSAAIGEQITLSWLGNSVTFTVAETPDDTGTQIPLYTSGSFEVYRDSVLEYMLKNELIHDNFYTETYDGGGIYYIVFYYNTQDAVDIEIVNDLTGFVVFDNPGVGPYEEDNLSCILKVIEYDQDDNATIGISLNAPFAADTGDAVFEIGNTFSVKPHLPSTSSIFQNLVGYTYAVASDAYKKYQLRFAERFGTPPVTQALQSSGFYYVIDGGYRFDGLVNFGSVLYAGQILAHNYQYPGGARWYKPVGEDQPDWVYVFTKSTLTDCIINVEVFFEDGTSVDFPYPDLAPFTLQANTLYWFPSGYQQLRISEADNPDNKLIVRYEWQLKPEAGSLLHARVGYDVDCACHPWIMYLLMANGLGGCESIRLKGKAQQKYTASNELFRRTRWKDMNEAIGEESAYFQEGSQSYEVSTGWYPGFYIQHLRQLLVGDTWLIDTVNGRFIKVIITTSTIDDVEDDQDLYSLTISFRLAGYDKAYNYY